MALREEVELSIQRAQQQIDQLQSQLAQLSSPLVIPVDVQGEEAVTQLQQQLADADQQVDVTVNTQGIQGAEAQFRSLSGEIDDTEGELRDAQVQADRLGDELDTTGRRGVQAFGNLRSAVGPLVAVFGAGIGLRALTDQFRAAIDEATALTESINAVNVIFGEGGQAIEEFGRTAASSVGLAASQVNQLVTPIGALLQNFGLEGREAADAALELTQRAADLASVFNTEVDEALTAIGSALRGEQEPIRRFGVNLNAAAADARALELGLVGVGEEVSIAARGQANYSLLLEQTAFAAGDFANTADSAANRQRILTAEFKAAQAELGTALLPAFEQLLDIGPDVIDAFTDMIPVVELAARQFQSVADDILPVIGLLGTLADVAGAAGDALGGIELGSGLSDIFQLGQAAVNPAAPISVLVDEFENLQNLFTVGIDTDRLVDELAQLEARAEAGAEPIAILGAAFGNLREEGADAVGLLEQLAEATGISDDELAEFTAGLIRSADRMGLTQEEVRTLRDLLASLFDVGERGEGLNFERAGRGAQELTENLAATTGAVEGADRALLNLVFGVDQAGNNLPVLVRNFEDLAIAADDAGVGVIDFVRNLPDDVTLNLGDAEQEVLDLIDALDEAATRLAEIDVSAAFGDVGEVDEDTGRIVGDIDQFLTDLEERAGELADLDFDLSQIQLVAPNLAELLAQSGLEAADIAAAFAANLDRAAEAEALITGAEGLAAATAEAYAEFLAELTPQQLADLAVFGADNLISPAVTGQLGDTASEIAEILADGIANSPELVLDMANATVEGLQNQGEEIASQLSRIISQNIRLDASLFATEGTTSGTTSGTGGGGGGATQNFEVNINNAVTEDVTTSATQAGQTIQAVSSLLPRVQ